MFEANAFFFFERVVHASIDFDDLFQFLYVQSKHFFHAIDYVEKIVDVLFFQYDEKRILIQSHEKRQKFVSQNDITLHDFFFLHVDERFELHAIFFEKIQQSNDDSTDDHVEFDLITKFIEYAQNSFFDNVVHDNVEEYVCTQFELIDDWKRTWTIKMLFLNDRWNRRHKSILSMFRFCIQTSMSKIRIYKKI